MIHQSQEILIQKKEDGDSCAVKGSRSSDEAETKANQSTSSTSSVRKEMNQPDELQSHSPMMVKLDKTEQQPNFHVPRLSELDSTTEKQQQQQEFNKFSDINHNGRLAKQQHQHEEQQQRHLPALATKPTHLTQSQQPRHTLSTHQHLNLHHRLINKDNQLIRLTPARIVAPQMTRPSNVIATNTTSHHWQQKQLSTSNDNINHSSKQHLINRRAGRRQHLILLSRRRQQQQAPLRSHRSSSGKSVHRHQARQLFNQQQPLRVIPASEYKNLRQVVPSLKRQRDVGKVEVVTEAARYIDHLHKTLVERFMLCGIPDSMKELLGTDNANELNSNHIMRLVTRMAQQQQQSRIEPVDEHSSSSDATLQSTPNHMTGAVTNNNQMQARRSRAQLPLVNKSRKI